MKEKALLAQILTPQIPTPPVSRLKFLTLVTFPISFTVTEELIIGSKYALR